MLLVEGSDFLVILGYGICVIVNEWVLFLGNIKLMKEEVIELLMFV